MDKLCLLQESHFSVAIRDPIWKHIWLTPELHELMRTDEFCRLYRIKQLGPTEYVYPGATHTRAAHSIGVYHVALKILRVLLQRGADTWVSTTGCFSFLAAALLHDLGHFPFTHSLKELPLSSHEELTANLILSEPLKTCIGKAGADPYMTAAIICKQVETSTGDSETVFFRNLLSGVLDPDKIDYLDRDAYYCGVPYGIQDTDFILAKILPDQAKGIVLDSRSIMAIESILFSKYLMYRAVYWHKQVRIATAMMKKTLYSALAEKRIVAEELYRQDDTGIFNLVEIPDFLDSEAASCLKSHTLYAVILEFPFDNNNTHISLLENIDFRTETESQIATYVSGICHIRIPPSQIIIDIPEQISFESELYLTDIHATFSKSTTIFSNDVIKKFVSSIRMVRIAIHPSYAYILTEFPFLQEQLAKYIGVGYTNTQGC